MRRCWIATSACGLLAMTGGGAVIASEARRSMGRRLNQTPPFAIDAPLLDCPVGLPPLTIAFVVATWAVLLGRRACRARR